MTIRPPFKALPLAALMICSLVIAQTIIVIMHEHVHSGLAWALGYTNTPFTVVWGNPITMRGWDEGVPYDRLFPHSGNAAEALIGGGPLLMHAVFLALSLPLLTTRFLKRHPISYVALYWFAVVNVAELVAYILMRPFIPTGDTGRFAEGSGLSPWVLSVVGLAVLGVSFWMLAQRITPVLDQVVGASRSTHWTLVVATAFIIFLWDSGIRMMSLFPDPQWKTGLIGVAGFFVWLPFSGLSAPPRSARACPPRGSARSGDPNAG